MPKTYTKYTKELLTKACNSSISIAGVIRFLGLKEAGGTHYHVARKIRAYGIDTSHFLGRIANSGPNHKGPIKKLTPEQILVKRTSGPRTAARLLRRALIDSGVEYKCECGITGMWKDKPLMLQVDHKNRDWLDNSIENLRFICPNCHSQTAGWCKSKDLSGVKQTYSSKITKDYWERGEIRQTLSV